ncbi:MAG: hypothetical protein A2632_00800 [Candidatus Pacebacteria bacterium RIFCSPHIGHO2_01_FULL_46_16]|nr:MAG: hypothetical protein A2632_00800 [Candidatus Pacebacteria bacterium RIFCSPHIGHO2_01_FULL_46_16]
MSLSDRVALGTVQFGLDYGIQSPYPQVSLEEVDRIVTYAQRAGIGTIDTAAAYGESEQVLGKVLSRFKHEFKIVSKLTASSPDQARQVIVASLKKLNNNYLYGYLIHDFEQFKNNPKIYTVLQDIQSEHKVKKIGFSFYFLKDLEYVLKNKIPFELVQLPYNIFDRRFEPYLDELKEKKVEIHARSVFLQGLFFRNPYTLPKYFEPIKNQIISLQRLANKLSLPINILCLLFVLGKLQIDKLVLGVHTVTQLQHNLEASNFLNRINELTPQLDSYQIENLKMIVPLYWPK